MAKVEEWRDIEGYDGLYQVSNKGRVKSSDRVQLTPRKLPYMRKGRILKQQECRGYKTVSITRLGKKKTLLVHRLVSEAYIKNPENKREVNHIDGDKSNNNSKNLEWSTRLENASHARKTGLYQLGEDREVSKLDDIKVLTIRTMTHLRGKDFGKLYGVAENTVLCARRGKTWKHLPLLG